MAIGRFLISGSNFTNTINILIQDTYVENYTILNDNLITGEVPDNAISGPITVNTYGGQAISAGNLNVTYPNIFVDNISPVTGQVNDLITISGRNFYRISQVSFGSGSGNFTVPSSGVIKVNVPENAITGYISIISAERQKTGTSTINFIPFPRISGFIPLTGTSGTQITITGFNFNGTVNVFVNNISVTGFNVSSNTQIISYIPSGNVFGPVKIIGPSGISVSGTSTFNATVLISGINPNTGNNGTTLSLSGQNFQTGLMYNRGDNTFQVSFNGGITGLYWVSNTLLTGKFPPNGRTGPVYIFKPDGASTYSSTGSFTKIVTPFLQSIIFNYAYSGSGTNFAIYGTGLINANGIIFTGVSGNATGERILITGNRIYSDTLGFILNVSGFLFSGYKTGYYNCVVSGQYENTVPSGNKSVFTIKKF